MTENEIKEILEEHLAKYPPSKRFLTPEFGVEFAKHCVDLALKQESEKDKDTLK